jgi:uncharacterized protein YsxB (DUF464 family)
MIIVTVRRDCAGNICCIQANGHADFADNGSDIICSGVSTLIYTAIGAIQELCSVDHFFRIAEALDSNSVPFAQIDLPDFDSEEKARTAQTILRTIEVGLIQLEASVKEQYGNQFLQIKRTKETSRRCKQ